MSFGVLPQGTLVGGSFRVVDLLGRGGMSVVYRAIDERQGRVVAVKVLSPEASRDPRLRERFRREARAATSILHPNVMSTYSVGRASGGLYIVFEFLPGGSLRDRLRASGRLPWREAASLFSQVARGLAAIHAAGLVHRDVKPANILLSAQGTPKLADFGVVRSDSQSGSDEITEHGEMVGTLEFMAPEQANGSGHADARADLYSLGGTLYATLTGAPPFAGVGYELIRQHMTGRPDPPAELVPGIPRELDRLVLRLLEKDPGRRGPGAAEVSRELAAIARGGPRDEARERRGAFVLAATCAAALALAAAVWPPAARGGTASPPSPSLAPPSPTVHVKAPRTLSYGEEPDWYGALPASDRPGLPLPQGLSFGTAKGEYVNAKDGSVLVWAPEGTVQSTARGGPVSVAGLFFGKLELTNARFRAFVAATGYVTTAERSAQGGSVTRLVRKTRRPNGTLDIDMNLGPCPGAFHGNPAGDGRAPAADHPVLQVSWLDAQEYGAWAGLRLPLEVEWELAALHDPRSGKTRRFSWGDEELAPGGPPLANVADRTFLRLLLGEVSGLWNGYDDGYARTAPAGSFPDGASPCGALDATGNVSELCGDPPALQAGAPAELAGKECVTARGGSWYDRGDRASGIARHLVLPASATDRIGFRVARSERDP